MQCAMRVLTLNQFQTLDTVLRLNSRRKTPQPSEVAQHLKGRPPTDIYEDLAALEKSGYVSVAAREKK